MTNWYETKRLLQHSHNTAVSRSIVATVRCGVWSKISREIATLIWGRVVGQLRDVIFSQLNEPLNVQRSAVLSNS